MGHISISCCWLQIAAFLALVVVCFPPAYACPAPEAALETGFKQMYNLDFTSAHQTFQAWQKSHPQDPLGFASDAAAYLFSEFDRLHVLESDLFTNDDKFKSRKRLSPDPAVRTAFETDLERSEQLANQTSSDSAMQKHAALFARVLTNGLRGDYVALIDKRNFAGLGYIKNSRAIAQQLLSADPDCYDAYLAVGAENYLLGLNAAPVRWMLRLTGAQTDKQEGLSRLRLAAEKGHYLAPYAKLLLAIAALRDKDRSTARSLLQGLAHEFPKNELYARELAQIPK